MTMNCSVQGSVHAIGLCYRNISSNLFFDPKSGGVAGHSSTTATWVLRTGPVTWEGPRDSWFPRSWGKRQPPSQLTDLFLFAVLLFLVLFCHHPLKGKASRTSTAGISPPSAPPAAVPCRSSTRPCPDGCNEEVPEQTWSSAHAFEIRLLRTVATISQ